MPFAALALSPALVPDWGALVLKPILAARCPDPAGFPLPDGAESDLKPRSLRELVDEGTLRGDRDRSRPDQAM